MGKMVHDLFEAILALDGFDRYLRENHSPDLNLNLPSNKSDLKEVEFNDSSTADIQAAEKGIKSLTLTPSLIAHMDAALKSAASPSKEEAKHASTDGRASSKAARGKPRRGLDDQPLAPRTKDFGEQASFGTGYKFPSTPGPTGLNAAEWLVKYTLSFAYIYSLVIFVHSLTCVLGSNSSVFNEPQWALYYHIKFLSMIAPPNYRAQL